MKLTMLYEGRTIYSLPWVLSVLHKHVQREGMPVPGWSGAQNPLTVKNDQNHTSVSWHSGTLAVAKITDLFIPTLYYSKSNALSFS